MMNSPYARSAPKKWPEVTRGLLEEHPLKAPEIVDVVLGSWASIFDSRIGTREFRIGTHIFPKPQTMGFLLHELTPLELSARHPGVWRGDTEASEKDLVYVPDERFSIEVKTSSNPSRIFGNRSYAQETVKAKKAKSGYCLAINFEKFTRARSRPEILLVRFGWLDSADWIGQKAATGQQSRLPPEVEAGKLIRIYERGIKTAPVATIPA